jgi:signal transduction histidine kinase
LGSRRLYLQLYRALLASTIVCLLAVGLAFRLARDQTGSPSQRLGHAAAVLAETRPDLDPVDGPAKLAALADLLSVDIVIGDEGGPLLASRVPHPFVPPPRPTLGWRRGPTGPQLVVALGPDRWAALRPRPSHRRLPFPPFTVMLVVLAMAMAVASYPVARRVTRRLEALATGVERWGRGELAHRVPVEGRDEVATLAQTFNQAAARVDLLVEQQRQLLANTSHELRSPLARVRMGLELAAEETDAELRRGRVEEIRRDIVELDALIEELLLFARADSRVPHRPFEPVALRALLENEAARTGAAVAGPEAVVEGDPLLLRHVVRNLLENAQRHGGGREVQALIEPGPSGVVIAVEDRGPGIPDEDRERIFAPFYRAPSGGAREAAVAPGHGLGLSLVRQVARYHGGEARHVPREGGGSRFEVTLPAHPPRSAADAPDAADAAPA